MGMTQVISDLNSFSANIANFRHLYSPDDKKDSWIQLKIVIRLKTEVKLVIFIISFSLHSSV